MSKLLVATACLVLVFFPVIAQAQSTPAPETMSFWQARRAIVTASNYAYAAGGVVDPSSVRVTFESVQFDTGRRVKHYVIDIQNLGQVSVKCNQGSCSLVNAKGKTLNVTTDHHFILFASRNGYPVPRQSVQSINDYPLAAAAFARALNSLPTHASHQTSMEEFHQKAAAWRVLPSKPVLSGDVRVLRLAAEDAFKSQKPDEALNYYEMGVESDPTWAQGWFNAAIIAGQLGYCEDAAEHMQNYLELVPDAQDAQSARDQMDLWRFKAKQTLAHPAKDQEAK